MTAIVVSKQIEQPKEQVWQAISDLANHPRWMKDAVGLEFTTSQTSGVGTLMNVETKVGPFRTMDVLEVIAWDEGDHIVVDHRGIITGTGRLEARSRNGSTLVTWTETLHFPWWLGGLISAWAARPVLKATWKRNLDQLDSLLSSL